MFFCKIIGFKRVKCHGIFSLKNKAIYGHELIYNEKDIYIK